MYQQEFENYLTAHGIEDYKTTIRYYISWSNQNQLDILNPTYTTIIDFVAHNIAAGINNGTINNRLYAIRKYYAFLIDIGKVDAKILDEIKKFKNLKTTKTVKNVLDKSEFAGLVGHSMTLFRKHKAEKIRALLFLMFYTGLRAGEIVNLKREHFRLEKGCVVVKEPKNDQERYAYFPNEIGEYLRKYFVMEAEASNAFNMSYYQIWYLIHDINQFIGDGRKITPHSLRHSFANMLAENDINVRVAQKLLGHKDINSTMIYYDPDAKIVEKIYRAKVNAIQVIKPQKGEINGQESDTPNA